MAGRLSKRYRFVVYKQGDDYTAKPVAQDILPQKRESIRQCRSAVKAAGVGAHGAVYAGDKLDTLVYQVRNTFDDAGAAGKLVVEEL